MTVRLRLSAGCIGSSHRRPESQYGFAGVGDDRSGSCLQVLGGIPTGSVPTAKQMMETALGIVVEFFQCDGTPTPTQTKLALDILHGPFACVY